MRYLWVSLLAILLTSAQARSETIDPIHFNLWAPTPASLVKPKKKKVKPKPRRIYYPPQQIFYGGGGGGGC